eukprot:XP_017951127.1 PREDICTED: myoferlin-like [Xenopus tropicalis]
MRGGFQMENGKKKNLLMLMVKNLLHQIRLTALMDGSGMMIHGNLMLTGLWMKMVSWEYGRASTPDNQPQHWVSSEKTYHTHRRRRLVRRRSKLSTPKEEVIPPKKDKGWEYAGVSGWRFHMKKCSTDTFRRRHWIRTLVSCGQQDVSSIFNLEGNLIHGNELKEGENDSKDNTRDFYREHVPFVSCKFDSKYFMHSSTIFTLHLL